MTPRRMVTLFAVVTAAVLFTVAAVIDGGMAAYIGLGVLGGPGIWVYTVATGRSMVAVAVGGVVLLGLTVWPVVAFAGSQATSSTAGLAFLFLPLNSLGGVAGHVTDGLVRRRAR